MLIGVASTMLIYIAEEKPLFYILGLEEFILLALTIIDMVKVSKANDAANKTVTSNIVERDDNIVPEEEKNSN